MLTHQGQQLGNDISELHGATSGIRAVQEAAARHVGGEGSKATPPKAFLQWSLPRSSMEDGWNLAVADPLRNDGRQLSQCLSDLRSISCLSLSLSCINHGHCSKGTRMHVPIRRIDWLAFTMAGVNTASRL